MANTTEHPLDLLEEALYFMNNVPNHKYDTKDGKGHYKLCSRIERYFRELREEAKEENPDG